MNLAPNEDLLEIRIAASQALGDPSALATATLERQRYQQSRVF